MKLSTVKYHDNSNGDPIKLNSDCIQDKNLSPPFNNASTAALQTSNVGILIEPLFLKCVDLNSNNIKLADNVNINYIAERERIGSCKKNAHKIYKFHCKKHKCCRAADATEILCIVKQRKISLRESKNNYKDSDSGKENTDSCVELISGKESWPTLTKDDRPKYFWKHINFERDASLSDCDFVFRVRRNKSKTLNQQESKDINVDRKIGSTRKPISYTRNFVWSSYELVFNLIQCIALSSLFKFRKNTFIDKMYLIRSMKLKERLAVGFVVSLILFTLLLVIDSQMDLGMSTSIHTGSYHKRLKYIPEDDKTGVFKEFQRKFLQKSNGSGSRELTTNKYSRSREDTSKKPHVPVPPTMNDKYVDLMSLLLDHRSENDPANFEKVIIKSASDDNNPSLADLMDVKLR